MKIFFERIRQAWRTLLGKDITTIQMPYRVEIPKRTVGSIYQVNDYYLARPDAMDEVYEECRMLALKEVAKIPELFRIAHMKTEPHRTGIQTYFEFYAPEHQSKRGRGE